MARSVRIEYKGAFYHVMARGNRREAIFLDDDDRKFFLHALSQACARTGWLVHAWVLMSNHYHLFLETPEGNLVEGMKWLQNTFTRRFNVRHRQWGRLFGDRYKAVLVESGRSEYYGTLLDYLHLNPVRAGLVLGQEGQSVLDYPWSSVAGGYALPPERRSKWFSAAAGLGAFGFADTVEGRKAMVERLDQRALAEGRESGIPLPPEEGDARMSHLRRGWYWGSQEFAQRVLKLGEGIIHKGGSRTYARSPERVAHGQKQAEQWVAEGLGIAGLGDEELRRLRGSDVRKIALAKLVWERTSVSQGWIANRLQMRSAANVCQLLARTEWKALRRKLRPDMQGYVQRKLAGKENGSKVSEFVH